MLNTAPLSDNDPDLLAIAALIERLQAAGHHVHRIKAGGFLVSRWGQSRHCMDFESLQEFAERVGA